MNLSLMFFPEFILLKISGYKYEPALGTVTPVRAISPIYLLERQLSIEFFREVTVAGAVKPGFPGTVTVVYPICVFAAFKLL